MLKTLRYKLSKKYNPIISGQKLTLSDFRMGANSKWDQRNLQVYQPSQIYSMNNGFCRIKAGRGPEKTMDRLWEEFQNDCLTWEHNRMSVPWEYISGALSSKKRIDIFTPGRIVVQCPMVHGIAAPSVWLFDEWHESHENDPLHRKGDCYFEIDMFESGPCPSRNYNHVYTSSHQGTTSSNRESNNAIIRGDFSDSNFYELQWDNGLFIWLINGVAVMEKFVKLNPQINPRILITLGVIKPMTKSVTWNINSIKLGKL